VYEFKFANQGSEIEQIHRLNYTAFVEEIPQHAPNPERRLVDQFHHENTYAIALLEDEVVAMLALRSNRPFSLDRKLSELESYLPPHRSLCEIRLLYVKPDHRNGKIMKGLMEMIALYAVIHKHDTGLISGTTRQQRFYKHLGFEPFGPLVGTGDALFQPMFLTVTAAMRQSPWVQALQLDGNVDISQYVESRELSLPDVGVQATLPIYDPPVNYLPGPVNIPPSVMAAMAQPMVSHRSESFLNEVERLQARLCEKVGAAHVEFLFGSGTLANDAAAAQLSMLGGHGLILINGEYGERLRDIAQRWQLSFDTLEIEWGARFAAKDIDSKVAANPSIAWIWTVHGETSTGVLNDFAGLVTISQLHNVKLCVDCISSFGVVDLDLSQVYLATATSGKALGAVTGLAMVFYNHELAPAPQQIPSYLDLGSYREAKGIPFTINSNLIYALSAALDNFDSENYARLAQDGGMLRRALRKMGVNVLAPDEVALAAVTTIVLPPTMSSAAVGDKLAEYGFWLSYRSRYLLERNWIQVCLMGEYRMDALPDLLRLLALLVPIPEQVAA